MPNIKFLILISILLAACSNPHLEKSDPNFLLENTGSAVDYVKAAKVNVELGLQYLNQGQIIRAKSKLLKAKKLAPTLPEAHSTYALYLEKVGEDLQSEVAYQKAIHLNPKLGSSHHYYGAFLFRHVRFEEAEKEFQLALHDPDYLHMAETYENLALCALQMSNQVKANQYIEKAARYRHFS